MPQKILDENWTWEKVEAGGWKPGSPQWCEHVARELENCRQSYAWQSKYIKNLSKNTIAGKGPT